MILNRAKPNEWMLVIKNGEMKKAGIGLRYWSNPFTETVARFPSRLETIHFNAEQVTKEMQGVEISGFAVWSVNRTDDGPFKYEAGERSESKRCLYRLFTKLFTNTGTSSTAAVPKKPPTWLTPTSN